MKTLIPNNPILEENYKSRVSIKLEDDTLPLEAEHMLYEYAKLLPKVDEEMNMRQALTQDKLFNRNFFNDLKTVLTAKQRKLQFPQDFMSTLKELKNIIDCEKIAKDEEKKTEEYKKQQDYKKSLNMAIIDDVKTKVNLTIEHSGIMIGRGDCKYNGCWKYTVKPQDIRINVVGDKIRAKELKALGYNVVSDKELSYVLSYSMIVGSNHIYNANKIVQLPKTSADGVKREQHKFEVAIQLGKEYSTIMSQVFVDMKSKDILTRENAMIVYLISQSGIRVGGEKDEDIDNGTVGASTLNNDNVKLDNKYIYLDFIGKDSVHDKRTIEMLNDDIKNAFEYNKSLNNNKFFTKATSITVNEYLKQWNKDYSAKKFRTYFGQKILQDAMKQIKWSKDMSDKQFKNAYDSCVLAVANQLNHKKTVSKSKQKETTAKTKQKLVDMKNKLSEDITKLEDKIDELDAKIKKTSDKEKLTVLKSKKKECKNKIADKKQKYNDTKEALTFKMDNMEVALNTSKANYSNPLIAMSLCNDMNKDPKLIYSKTLLEKFAWAKDAKKSYWKENI